MGTVETIFYTDLDERLCDFAADWIIVTTDCARIVTVRKESPMMKTLLLAACTFAALCMPATASASRKTGFIEFHEFDDLRVGENSMRNTYTAFSDITRCTPATQTVTSTPLGINCYVGGLSLDTEQLTVQSIISGEIERQTNNSSSDRSELSNSTTGIDEGTQLKERLA